MLYTPHHVSVEARTSRDEKRPASRLQSLSAVTLIAGMLVFGSAAFRETLPVVQPNPNVGAAGVQHDGVLTVALEAKETRWWLHGPDHSAMTIAAFAEPGKPPFIPGPLVRTVVGTEIRISIRNSLAKPITFLVPAAIHGPDNGTAGMDSTIIAPGDVQTFSTRARVAGNYMYRATQPGGPSKVEGMAGLLAGAIVVDTARADNPPRDRVFVILATQDSAALACDDTLTGKNFLAECVGRRFIYTINGRSWPNTERIHANVGDSLHWRVINASAQVHPMHLHGFYFRVDQYWDPDASNNDHFSPPPGQMVVTQLMRGTSTMSITWSPNQPGNWLFHCHLSIHTTPDSLSAQPDDPHRRDMNGLVIGTIVAPRPAVVEAGDRPPLRHLRLIAEPVLTHDASLTNVARPSPPWLGSVPSMHFVLEENGRRIDTGKDFSPEIDLTRGERVAITIVNHLDEPTSVHWHGIEVENSYMDGVPGFSGHGRQLTPEIAPGDSFIARFTPPRAGSFMYHPHVDELREDVAGLVGALIVRDPGSLSSDDHVLLLKGDGVNPQHPRMLYLQGSQAPVVMHVGRTAKLRLLNLSTTDAVPLFSLTARMDSIATIVRDTMLVSWRPVAKDGFDIPASMQTLRPARQLVSIGETYDFEYTPASKGTLQLEIREGRAEHPLLLRLPIRVEQ